MTATQMNIRIDPALKNAGDLAIREGGSTPSAVVRSVWEYASRNRHEPKAVSDLLDFLAGRASASHDEGANTASAADEVEQQVLHGPALVNECLAKMGVNPAAIEPMTYEDARAAAFDEDWEAALLA